jgi:hypothetical protein
VVSDHLPSRSATLILLATLLLAPLAGHAEPSAADKETARSLLDDGDKKLAAGDLQGALKAYKAADDIMGVPTTTLEVARTQIKLGLLVEARDSLQRLLRIPQAPKEPAAFTKARAEATRLNDDLQQRIPTLQVTLDGLPAGTVAEVTIDGEALPTTAIGLPRKLNPGLRRVVVSARGYQSSSHEVPLGEQQTRTLTVTLRPAVVEPPPLPSATVPPPSVSATTPPPPASTTSEPSPSSPPSAAEPPGMRRPMLVYGGFGLGVLGVTFGTISGLVALNKGSSVKDACDGDRCPERVRDDIVSTKNWALASNIGFAVGVAGAGAGLVALLVGGTSSTSARRPAVEPLIGVGNLGLRGQF